MVEQIVVWLLVGGVVLLVGRRFHKVLTGNTDGCGCGGGKCGESPPCDQSENVSRVGKDAV